MREILGDLRAVWERGGSFALAIVTATWSSAPRGIGAAMAVDDQGHAIGSISGGCVEGAVYEVAREVLSTGVARQVHYGVSDDDAFAVGLTCGGTIAVHVLRVDRASWPDFDECARRIEVGLGVILPLDSSGRIIPFDETGLLRTTGLQRLDDALASDAVGLLRNGRSEIVHYGEHGERRPDDLAFLVLSFLPPPTMYVFGAIDFARAVADVGSFLGFRTIVCDARATFATSQRFPRADQVIVEWPHRFLAREQVGPDDVICVLTHDPKFDLPLLVEALATPARYIGVMGSRRTHEQRLRHLRDEGITEAALARLRAPIGLDLGARTPEETAISIAAEIIRERWHGTGLPLTGLDGPIHRSIPTP